MFINCLYIVNDVILMLIIISLYREGKELMKPENSSYYDQFSQPLKRYLRIIIGLFLIVNSTHVKYFQQVKA